jgi:hypothetical protein
VLSQVPESQVSDWFCPVPGVVLLGLSFSQALSSTSAEAVIRVTVNRPTAFI